MSVTEDTLSGRVETITQDLEDSISVINDMIELVGNSGTNGIDLTPLVEEIRTKLSRASELAEGVENHSHIVARGNLIKSCSKEMRELRQKIGSLSLTKFKKNSSKVSLQSLQDLKSEIEEARTHLDNYSNLAYPEQDLNLEMDTDVHRVVKEAKRVLPGSVTITEEGKKALIDEHETVLEQFERASNLAELRKLRGANDREVRKANGLVKIDAEVVDEIKGSQGGDGVFRKYYTMDFENGSEFIKIENEHAHD